MRTPPTGAQHEDLGQAQYDKLTVGYAATVRIIIDHWLKATFVGRNPWN
ncbi:hypothetical protein [Leekyejoonella antrihumi]|nr:hypothetical protein [Leekyejoonella antrihumi]